MKENNSRENKVKYGHCEKATKFEKNLQPVSTFIKQRQNKWIFFSYFCGLFRKPELYTHLDQPLGLKFLLRNAVPSLQLKPGKAMVLKWCYVRLLLNWIMDSIFINLHKILGYKYLLLYKDSIPGSSVLKVTFFRKFDEAQNNMPNHYLKLEVLKLHLVVNCDAWQPIRVLHIGKKRSKIQMTSFR